MLRAIAAELNTRRVETVRGGERTAVQVGRIVKCAALSPALMILGSEQEPSHPFVIY